MVLLPCFPPSRGVLDVGYTSGQAVPGCSSRGGPSPEEQAVLAWQELDQFCRYGQAEMQVRVGAAKARWEFP